MIRLSVFTALIVFAASGAVAAQTAPVDATTAVAIPAQPIKEKKVCRREDTTGSIMTHSVCHTAAQWNAIDAQHANDAEALMRNRRMDH